MDTSKKPYLGQAAFSKVWQEVFPHFDPSIAPMLNMMQRLNFFLRPPWPGLGGALSSFCDIVPCLKKIIYISAATLQSLPADTNPKMMLDEMLREGYGAEMVQRLGPVDTEKLIQMIWELGGVLYQRKISNALCDLPKRYSTDLFANFRVCLYYFLGSAILGDTRWKELLKTFLMMFLAGNFPLQKTQGDELIVLTL